VTTGLGIIDEEALNLFTDGSSYPHRKRASGFGIRFVWVNPEGHEEIDDYAPPGWQSATIDEVEIQAVTEGLLEAKRMFRDMSQFSRVLVFSDSRYVVDNFTKAINVWPKSRWRIANGMPAANIELWKQLGRAVGKIPIRVDLEWVKAHKSNVHNKAADKLAKKSAAIPVNKPFSNSATTKKWSDRKTVRGCIEPTGQELKVRIISRKYISKAKTTEYRYEVVDSTDSNFQAIDFAYCDEALSRNHCYLVQLNVDATRPTFTEVSEELPIEDYKY